MIVRQFNQSGLKAFRDLLDGTREHPSGPVDRRILVDPGLTEIVAPEIDIAPQRFTTRGDAAAYLAKHLAPLRDDDVSRNAGLWSWLSLFYFDEVCPPKNGVRAVRNDYSYVFEPTNPRHFYRHLLYIAWYALRTAKPYERLYM